jgi:hypothetical protein
MSGVGAMSSYPKRGIPGGSWSQVITAIVLGDSSSTPFSSPRFSSIWQNRAYVLGKQTVAAGVASEELQLAFASYFRTGRLHNTDPLLWANSGLI